MRRTKLAIMAAFFAWSIGGLGLVAWGPFQHMRNQGSVDGGDAAGRAAASASLGLPGLVWLLGLLGLIGWSMATIGRDPILSASLAGRERRGRSRESHSGVRAGITILGALLFVTMGAGMVGEEAVLAAFGRKVIAHHVASPENSPFACRYEWSFADEARETLGHCDGESATIDYLPAFPIVARVSGGSAWGKVALGLFSLAIGVAGLWITAIDLRGRKRA